MVVERQHFSSSNPSPEHQYQNGNGKRVRATSAIYRPPAARRMENIRSPDVGSGPNIIPVSSKSEKTRSVTKQRRPDLQVYVPRAKRAEQELSDQHTPRSESSTSSYSQPTEGQRRNSSETRIRSSKTSLYNERRCDPISTTCTRTIDDQVLKELKVAKLNEKISKLSQKESDKYVTPYNSSPSWKRYVDFEEESEKLNNADSSYLSHRDRSFNSSSVLVNNSGYETDSYQSRNSSSSNETNLNDNSFQISSPRVISDDEKDESSGRKSSGEEYSNDFNVDFSQDNCSSYSDIVMPFKENTTESEESKSAMYENESNTPHEKVKDNSANDRVKAVPGIGSVESMHVCHKQEEQNKKNKNKIAGNFISDVLIISDPEPVAPKSPPLNEETVHKEKETKKKKARAKSENKTDGEKAVLSAESLAHLNPDECTWDMLFDENGDCLNPKLMEELTSAVGSVTIEKPKSNYDRYSTRHDLHLPGGDSEYAHVLEIYNFPPEFKTQDLIAVFSPYKNAGFEIKWVDDTHALGVFSSSRVAAEVLAYDHPFVKTRPLCNATPESRMKARRSAEFLQPYKTRPETCTALARRLVTGALGMKITTSREEREAERRQLREAKEKKRLAAQQQHDAWEGIIGEK